MRKPVRLKGEPLDTYLQRACRALFNGGHNINEIATKMKVTNTEVFNAIHDDMHFVTKDEEKLIQSLYLDGIPVRLIAKQIGVSEYTVRKRLNGKENAYDAYDNGEHMPDVDLETIKKLYTEEHKSTKAIASILDVSEHRVRYRLEKCGLYSYSGVKPVTKREIAKFNKLYKDGLSLAQIAKKCNRNRNTVSRYIKK
jgi:transposase